MTDLFKSDKKTITKERILKTLSAIGDLGIHYEGQGGRTAYIYGDYEVGTGLRSPDMPLYNKPKRTRHAILLHLEEKGLIKPINKDDDDEWCDLQISESGIQALKKFNTCEECKSNHSWYHTHGFVQTGQYSGYHTDMRKMFCECSKKEFMDLCLSSNNSNHKQRLGMAIESKIGEVQ